MDLSAFFCLKGRENTPFFGKMVEVDFAFWHPGDTASVKLGYWDIH